MNNTIYLINTNNNNNNCYNNKTYKIINNRIGSECHAPPRGGASAVDQGPPPEDDRSHNVYIYIYI